MKFLDIGCGSCKGSYPDYEIYGVDINPDNIKECRHKFPEGHFSVCDIRVGLPFPDKYFDIVNTSAILMYIKDIKPVINEIKRVGKEIRLKEFYSPNSTIRRLFPLFCFVFSIRYAVKSVFRHIRKENNRKLSINKKNLTFLFKYYLHDYPKLLNGKAEKTPKSGNILCDIFGYSITTIIK